jgi:hypothetical protein
MTNVPNRAPKNPEEPARQSCVALRQPTKTALYNMGWGNISRGIRVAVEWAARAEAAGIPKPEVL